ncbi:MmyB family transcriptional regulator [Streptomyces spectabilis]|uniref:Transcriptional regulator with XRE-family HTH domain n=1 Tax=Streptomyces spectabilis TaxID=68270 RepID=A0A5P2X6F0_STRST|nr:helix-turn-helix domain-containing protein [Streptomyces spectabilis]MBB5106795.1 transcriptional regulator with XRE-family HTH domain [Streptomyces spectabilis]MCI3903354.1 helix-turn-helix domain-containing protein [Streptomyces spectabilis]QEV60573.1 XRE family transcriptional regulator [Streptomyces spectabilis]GGV43872.1 transcriptional regulator [Streptomyces spectabilis]
MTDPAPPPTTTRPAPAAPTRPAPAAPTRPATLATDPAALRRELGGFLRAHRERVAPADVGLPGTARRRTSGLRREEVAALSGVSVAWYTWLEQGRVDTSRQVLDAVARTLRLDAAAHRHALGLAGFATFETGPSTPVDHQPMLDGWATPAALLDPALDLRAWNGPYAALWPDPAHVPPARRNLLLLLATDPGHQRVLPDWEPLATDLYRHFRTRADREPPASRSHEVTALLRAERPELDAWWACRSVADFAPRAVTLTAPDGDVRPYEMTLLLTPEPRGGAVLVQTPVGGGPRAPGRT